MKKIILSLAAISSFVFAFGQGEMDALKYSQTDIQGTARYTSMAGAMGALGGDASAIVDNPASLGIYRKWDLNITPGITWTSTRSGGNNDFSLGATLDNLALIASFMTGKDKGDVAHNIGINYNRLRNFRSDIAVNKYNSPSSLVDFMVSDRSSNALWDLGYNGYLINENGSNILANGETVDKRYLSEERGTIDEWNFSYSANISNILYLGATLGVQSLDYRFNSTYSEDFVNQGNNNGFDLYNDLETSGSGVNFKIGAIVRPVDFLRVGASFTTPTVYDLEDRFKDAIDYKTEKKSGYYENAWGVYDYSLRTPYKVLGSLGFVIGQSAVIGINYEMKDFSTTKLGKHDYSFDNQNIKEHLKKSHTFKIGGEYLLNDEWALRAGYALTTTPFKTIKVEESKADIYTAGTTPNYSIPHHYSYYSLGFGYHAKHFYFDAAYSLNVKNDNLYLYPNTDLHAAEAIKTQSFTNNVVATLGFRF